MNHYMSLSHQWIITVFTFVLAVYVQARAMESHRTEKWESEEPPAWAGECSLTRNYICIQGADGCHKGMIRSWLKPTYPAEITKLPERGCFIADFLTANRTQEAIKLVVGKLLNGKKVRVTMKTVERKHKRRCSTEDEPGQPRRKHKRSCSKEAEPEASRRKYERKTHRKEELSQSQRECEMELERKREPTRPRRESERKSTKDEEPSRSRRQSESRESSNEELGEESFVSDYNTTDEEDCEIIQPLERHPAGSLENYKLLKMVKYAEYGMDSKRRVVRKETTVEYQHVILN